MQKETFLCHMQKLQVHVKISFPPCLQLQYSVFSIYSECHHFQFLFPNYPHSIPLIPQKPSRSLLPPFSSIHNLFLSSVHFRKGPTSFLFWNRILNVSLSYAFSLQFWFDQPRTIDVVSLFPFLNFLGKSGIMLMFFSRELQIGRKWFMSLICVFLISLFFFFFF